MKVSIIVPVYNVAPYIEKNLQSVFAQTYQDIELILVDDCGTDNSVDIVNQLLLKNKGSAIETHFLHHSINKGLSSARNTGTQSASGDYIFYLDSDDLIPNNCINTLVNYAIKYNPDIVVGKYSTFIDDQKPICKDDQNDYSIYHDFEIIEALNNKKYASTAWNKLIKHDFIVNNKLFFKEGLIYEDELWSFIVSCTAKTMIVCNSITYFYRIRNNSIMSINSYANRLSTCMKIYGYFKDYITTNHLENNKSVILYTNQWYRTFFEGYNFFYKLYNNKMSLTE